MNLFAKLQRRAQQGKPLSRLEMLRQEQAEKLKAAAGAKHERGRRRRRRPRRR